MHVQKRMLITTFALSAVLVAAGCSSSGSGTKSPGAGGGSGTTVTLGEVTDFSGPASVYGIAENQGAQIAVNQINAAGGIKSLGGAKLAIKKYDTESDPNKGQTQATSAVGDHVSAVFGGEISDTVLAGINVTQRAGVPWIDAGGIADEIPARGYKTVFLVDHTTTQFMQDYLGILKQAQSTLGLTSPTVAIAYSQSSYGEGFLAAFNKLTAGTGLKVTTSFGYPLTTTNFSSIAARLAASKADIVFDLGYPGDGLALTKLFATNFKLKSKMFVAAGSDAASVVGDLKTQANGVIFNGELTSSTKNLPASFDAYDKAYIAAYHTAPNSQASSGYIAVQFLAAAMEQAKSSSPSAIVGALKSVTLTQTTGNIFPEPSTLKFGSDGALADAPFFGAQIQNGKPVIIYPSSVATSSVTAYSG